MARIVQTAMPLLLMLAGAAFAASPATAQTADELKNVVESKICPADLSKYRSVTVKEFCGENKSNAEMNQCVPEWLKMELAISEYNIFMTKCASN